MCLSIIIDTDAGNETDDQFALLYAMLAPEIFQIRGICAAPFFHYRVRSEAEGMFLSFLEIRRLTGLAKRSDIPAITGARSFFGTATRQFNPAAEFLAREAMRHTPEHPLYCFSIAALTNIADALLRHPEISDRIVLVWLGSHSYREEPGEFNLLQDLEASRVVFNSTMRKILFPCRGVAEKLWLTEAEVRRSVEPCGAAGRFLSACFRRQISGNGAPPPEHGAAIWDIAPFARWITPEAVRMEDTPGMTLGIDPLHWRAPNGRIEPCCAALAPEVIFADFFRRLSLHHQWNPELKLPVF